MLDADSSNRVSKDEVMGFFVKLVDGKQSSGPVMDTDRLNEDEIEMVE